MSEPNGTPSPSERDELAGVYIYIEGPEQVYVPPRTPKEPSPQLPEHQPPTTDELAGVYFYIAGPEQVNVPPKQPPPAPPPSNP